MSDNFGFQRPDWGNSPGRWRGERQAEGKYSSYPHRHRRVLVEECHPIDVRELQKLHGRKKLLRAADEGKPIKVHLGGHSFDAHFYWEPHRLPGRTEKWSDIGQGNCRIWLVCMHCRRKVRALYRNPLPLVSDLPPIGCRRCLRLVYACENSGKTKWWKKIVRPLRHLYRRREKLHMRKRTPRVIEELNRIEELIFVYTKRAEPKRRTRRPTGMKRPYRNVGLVLGLS
jgi:hypothetical protein